MRSFTITYPVSELQATCQGHKWIMPAIVEPVSGGANNLEENSKYLPEVQPSEIFCPCFSETNKAINNLTSPSL